MPRCRSRGSVVIPIPNTTSPSASCSAPPPSRPSSVARMPVAGQAIAGADLGPALFRGKRQQLVRTVAEQLVQRSPGGSIAAGTSRSPRPASRPRRVARRSCRRARSGGRTDPDPPASIRPGASLAARDRGSHRCRDRSPARRSGRGSRRHLQGGGLPGPDSAGRTRQRSDPPPFLNSDIG